MAGWMLGEPDKLTFDSLDRVVVELVAGRSAWSAATTGPPWRCRSWTGGRCGSARRAGR